MALPLFRRASRRLLCPFRRDVQADVDYARWMRKGGVRVHTSLAFDPQGTLFVHPSRVAVDPTEPLFKIPLQLTVGAEDAQVADDKGDSETPNLHPTAGLHLNAATEWCSAPWVQLTEVALQTLSDRDHPQHPFINAVVQRYARDLHGWGGGGLLSTTAAGTAGECELVDDDEHDAALEHASRCGLRRRDLVVANAAIVDQMDRRRRLAGLWGADVAEVALSSADVVLSTSLGTYLRLKQQILPTEYKRLAQPALAAVLGSAVVHPEVPLELVPLVDRCVHNHHHPAVQLSLQGLVEGKPQVVCMPLRRVEPGERISLHLHQVDAGPGDLQSADAAKETNEDSAFTEEGRLPSLVLDEQVQMRFGGMLL